MNLSFQNENNNREYIPEEVTQKNPYIMEDHVPEIEIINKNEMTCDKKKYSIKDYLRILNNNSNDSNKFLDDIIIYNYCGKCKNDLNKYFCQNCYENICNKCYENTIKKSMIL